MRFMTSRNVGIAAAILVALVASVWYFHSQSSRNPSDTFVSAVRRHMLFDSSDTPIVMQIDNAGKLQTSNPFYRGAKIGDILLIFPVSQMAVIYNPQADLIINAGPLRTSATTTPKK